MDLFKNRNTYFPLLDDEEIAKVALFLSTEDASYINGSIVTVDGGWTAY